MVGPVLLLNFYEDFLEKSPCFFVLSHHVVQQSLILIQRPGGWVIFGEVSVDVFFVLPEQLLSFSKLPCAHEHRVLLHILNHSVEDLWRNLVYDTVLIG